MVPYLTSAGGDFWLSGLYSEPLLRTPCSPCAGNEFWLSGFYSEPLLVPHTPATLTQAAHRHGVCTIVLCGAPWDNYFQRMVSLGLWERLAREAAQLQVEVDGGAALRVEVGFLVYSYCGKPRKLRIGYGDRWRHSFSPWERQGYSVFPYGSYDARAFVGGIDVGEGWHDWLSTLGVSLSDLINNVDGGKLRALIAEACGGG
ncbi:hypothetical protein JKP88DRAFT_279372 [Tribonema minus]|uniref:Uncharacterized protein n=1 Tax=Tribonema minus TaxID=303371 RepID=A0A835YWA2_9STRA|nr:hypothetical protein JKP88DRAFT_279372 [Tribonema minus]